MGENFKIPRMDEPLIDEAGRITRSWYNYLSDLTSSGTDVRSVTGLATDDSDPTRPVIGIAVDGVSITGTGTPDNPLVADTNVEWGQITGDISNQTDLQTALTNASILTGYTSGTLPAGQPAGRLVYITDQQSSSGNVGDPVSGGGTLTCAMLYDGSVWRVT